MLLSTAQVARILGISRSTVWRLCRQGEIDHKTVDRHNNIRIELGALREAADRLPYPFDELALEEIKNQPRP